MTFFPPSRLRAASFFAAYDTDSNVYIRIVVLAVIYIYVYIRDRSFDR